MQFSSKWFFTTAAMGVQWNKQKNGFCFSCAWLKEIQRKSTSNFRGHSAWRNILMTDLFIDMCKTVFYYILLIFTIFSMSSSILNVFTLKKKKKMEFFFFSPPKDKQINLNDRGGNFNISRFVLWGSMTEKFVLFFKLMTEMVVDCNWTVLPLTNSQIIRWMMILLRRRCSRRWKRRGRIEEEE